MVGPELQRRTLRRVGAEGRSIESSAPDVLTPGAHEEMPSGQLGRWLGAERGRGCVISWRICWKLKPWVWVKALGAVTRAVGLSNHLGSF